MTDQQRRLVLIAQRLEITGYTIYERLSRKIKDTSNSDIMAKIAKDELRHYHFWKAMSGRDIAPRRSKVVTFVIVSRLLGLTFGIKLLERGEDRAQRAYEKLRYLDPEIEKLLQEEEEHEEELIGLLHEEHLQYVGSVVLGLNDALVELTGALAGLTFALQNTRLIALTGLITGIAASFSMAASEFLSTRAEGGEEAATAGKAALYTGLAYIFTVILLVLPYLLIENYFVCLIVTILIAVVIIFVFNYYISVAKDLSFAKRFGEMTGLSLGVAVVSFGIGYVVRIFLGVEV